MPDANSHYISHIWRIVRCNGFMSKPLAHNSVSPSAVQYSGVVMGAIASQITSLTSVYSTDYSGADQRKHQSSASLAFVCGIHRWPVNSQHKWPVTRKMFPFDDFIMVNQRTPRIGFSSTLSCDFQPLTYGDFKVISDVNLSKGKTFWNK